MGLRWRWARRGTGDSCSDREEVGDGSRLVWLGLVAFRGRGSRELRRRRTVVGEEVGDGLRGRSCGLVGFLGLLARRGMRREAGDRCDCE